MIRTHGGAAMAERISFEFEFLNRVRENHLAKDAIATAAAAIKDGESVMLDSGTTTLALAKRLRGRQGLTVITSSLPIAAQLQFDQGIEVLLLGGRCDRLRPIWPARSRSPILNASGRRGFFGADAVHRHGAVYQESPELARMLTRMFAAAARVFVVADGSKLGKTALWRFGLQADWAALITDAAGDRSLRRVKGGVRIIKAG